VTQKHFELDGLPGYEDQDILSEIRRVADAFGDAPLTQEKFDEIAKVHSDTVRKRFGGWRAALEAAGLAHRFVGAKRPQIYTNAAMISEIQRIARLLGSELMSRSQFRGSGGRMNPETIARRFGDWETAVKSAGLKPAQKSKPYTVDDYFDNLLTVWTYYGRQPKHGDMDEPPSCITAGAYEYKFGTWRKALLSFIKKVNSDSHSSQKLETHENRKGEDQTCFSAPNDGDLAHQTNAKSGFSRGVAASALGKAHSKGTRSLTIGMRYDVLRRDRFRCALCGASPATDPACQLHVDHIVPCSKGGQTTLDNLRALCSRCNVGKAAKTE